MSQDKSDMMKEAISERRTIKATYNGLYRELSVAVLGFKIGKLHVLAYQNGGETSSGPITGDSPDNWRCFVLERLENPEFIDKEWRCQSSRERIQTCVDIIILEA